MTRLAKAALLLFFFSLCGAAFVVTHRLREDVPSPAPHELFAVLSEQLAAFRAADYPGAYRSAASGLQQRFTQSQFEAMIRQSYAEFATAHRIEFGSVQVQSHTAFVQVFIFADEGSVRVLLYTLLAEDGAWKIGDVEELSSPRPSSQLVGTRV